MSDDSAKTASEVVDGRQLAAARDEGEGYERAVDRLAAAAAAAGGPEHAGDYVVRYVQGPAEGAYVPAAEGGLEWVGPQTENCHLGVAVADADDSRFVPHLSVTATLVADDEALEPVELPYVWHPGASHYGADLTVPGDGTYDLQVRIDPAGFHRQDRDNGDRYDDPAEVVFEDVSVQCGQR